MLTSKITLLSKRYSEIIMSSVKCIDELTKERSGRVYHGDPFLICAIGVTQIVDARALTFARLRASVVVKRICESWAARPQNIVTLCIVRRHQTVA